MFLEEYNEEEVRQIYANEAHEKGLEQGRITMLFDAVNAGEMTSAGAARLSGTTEEDFLKKLAAYND